MYYVLCKNVKRKKLTIKKYVDGRENDITMESELFQPMILSIGVRSHGKT